MAINCIPVVEEQVRAEIYLGNVLLAKTPFVISFSINKSREQLGNTASIVVEILAGTTFPLGESIRIRAGIRGSLKDEFSGEIRDIRTDPSFGKPSYYRLTIQAAGVLSKLQGKRFSRRLRSDGQGLFCSITGSAGARSQSGHSLDAPRKAGNVTRLSTNVSPSPDGKGNLALVTYNNNLGSSGLGGRSFQLANSPNYTGTGSSSESLGVHDHSDLEKGGPAWGTYSSD